MQHVLNTSFKMHIKYKQGFALITELISLLVFGLGVLALSSLSEKTITSNSESLQKIHATWLANSLISKITMNSTGARSLEYNQKNVTCDAKTPTTRTQADLTALFCPVNLKSTWAQTKPIDIMGEINWTITCKDSDPLDSIACSNYSFFTVTIDWQKSGGSSIADTNGIRYEFLF